MDFVPCLDSVDGFAPRAYHLLQAIAEQWPLDVFALDRSREEQEDKWVFPPAIEVNSFWRESVGSNPLYDAGLKGKIRRSAQYTFARRSAMSYPRQLARLEERVAAHPPKLAIFFLPFVAHFSFDLPKSVPCLYLLEEGLERSFSWVAPGLPAWKRKWVDNREQAHARRLYRRIAQKQGHVVAISENEKKWFAQTIPERRITVVPHGIDCEFYQPCQTEQDIDVAIFGSLGHRRTYEPALELYSFIKAHRPDLHHLRWAFVGSRPHPSLQAISSDRVEVTGFVPNVRPYYSRSKIVIVPSRYGGGVKTTLLQGWAMGRPVVATPFALSGLPAVAEKNVLVGESCAALSDQVARLISSPELRARVGNAGRATACAERNIRVIADQFAQLCGKVMGEAD